MIDNKTIKNNWLIKPLGKLVDFLDNQRKPVKASERKPGEYPYYGANGQQGTIDSYLFDEPLILLAEDGGFFGIPGKKIAYKAEGKYWVNNHAHVLRPKDNMNIDFLVRQLERYNVSQFISGSTRPKLTKGSSCNIPISFPHSLQEQKRIAGILDKADTLRQKREQTIELADQFLRSVFLDMFGDPVKNPKGWQEVTIGDVTSDIKDGPHVSPTYVEEGIPILSTRNIRPGKLILQDLKYLSKESFDALTRYFKPQMGDVLLTKGGTTGYAKVVDFNWEFAIWVHLAALRPNEKIMPEFLELMLNTKYCYKQSQIYTRGIVNKDLGLTRIRKIKIYLPPITIQEKYCKYRTVVLSLINDFEKLLKQSGVLFNSLTQRAFRGEL